MKFSVKKRANLKLRDAFRVEALEPRVLLSADPIVGLAAVILPDDAGHDHLIHDAYQGDTAPADPAASHAQVDQLLANAAAAAASTTPAAPVTPSPAAPASPTAGATIAGADPTRTIFLGDDAEGGLDSNGTLYVSNAALGNLTGGFSTIQVGGADSNAHIIIGDTSGSKDIVLNDSLTLINPNAGGEIFINQKLTLQGDAGLVIMGSGHTTTVNTDVTAAFYSIGDSIKINGAGGTANTIHITATGSYIELGTTALHSLNGDGAAPDDFLVLSAATNIVFNGKVGDSDPLEGLTITNATNVDFKDAVTVNGNLDIHATGIVTFAQPVHLTAGALHITGASQIVFNGGVVVDGGGDIYLEGDEIDFGPSVGTGAVKGTGMLTLRPTTVGMNIDVAGPPLENVADLNLSSFELSRLFSTFTHVVVGRESAGHADPLAGAVRIGAIQQSQQYTFHDQLEVYGRTITVEDYNDAGFQFLVDGKMTLDAYSDITIRNTIGANGAGLVLYSETGAITEQNAAGTDNVNSETVRGADLHAHAGNGIYLPWLQVNTVTAINTGDGNLVIGNLARDDVNGVGGALQIDQVSQTSLLGDAIVISTSAGGIALAQGGAGVHTVSGGAIGITAGGTNSTITVNAAIGGTSGAIALAADGAVNVALGTISDSGAAAITLTSTSSDIIIGRDISSAGGLVHLGAGGAVNMASGTSLRSLDAVGDTGAVTINAAGAITVSIINADGAIGIASSAGAIVDGLSGDFLNLDGDTATATLAAATGIGSGAPLYTRVAALSATNTTSGNVAIREATALRLLGATLAGTGASLAVQTLDGGIVVEGMVNSTGTVGNILLQSAELLEATAADIEVRANVGSSSGSISLIAADSIAIDDLAGGAPLIETRASAKTIELTADGSIAMEGLARLQTANGNIRIAAQGGDVSVGIVSAGTGAISVRAAGRILDGQDDDADANLTLNLSAASVRLDASTSIGASSAALDIQTGLLASTGRATYLVATSSMTIGSVAAVAVNHVAADASVSSLADSAALAGATAATGNMILTGISITVDQAVTVSGGSLRLEGTGNIVANAAIGAANHVSLIAGGALTQNAASVLSATNGTIDVQAGGAILMADGARTVTNAQNIAYRGSAAVTISLIDARSNADRGAATVTGQAGWGNVLVRATGAIVDAAESGASTDIYANALRITAGGVAGTIGSAVDALDLEVATLNAVAGAAAFINEASALTLGPVASIVVQRVLPNGAVDSNSDGALAGVTTGGALVLQAGGAITSVADGAIAAGGNLLLAAAGDIVLGAAVATTGAIGNISLNASGDIVQNAAISAAGAGQSIDLVATRHIVMADASSSTANGGNIGLRAGGDATIETLAAGTGAVSINASGSILDQDADGDSEVDVIADKLQLNAGAAIGSAANALETSVATVSARAGSGGLYLAETDGLIVDTVTVQVNRVDAAALATATAYAAQSNLVALGAGNIVVQATELTVSDDVSAAAGNILLKASSGDLTVNNSITSSTGAVSLAAGAALAQKALVSGASVDILAATSIGMDDGVSTIASGNIRYQTGTTLSVGTINSGATVSLVAASVSDSGSTDTDIIAATLRIQTVNGFGAAGAHLNTTIATLAGSAGAGGLFIDESDALAINSVAAVSTARVNAAGVLGSVQDAAVSTFTSGAAAISSAGAMAVNAATNASGNLLLQTTGAAADLTVAAIVSVSGGSATLAAGRDLLINSTVQNLSAGQTLDLQAVNDIGMSQSGGLLTGSGNIALTAGRKVTVETINTSASVSIVAQTGAIVDGDGGGDSEVDIFAVNLLLRAGAGIGTATNVLETTVGTMTAQGGSGGVYLLETNDVTIDGVTVQVNRVDGQGVATATANAMQNNLTATGSGNVVLSSNNGVMTIADTVSTVTGNLLLQAATGMVINDAISAAGGALSLFSAGAITQRANIANSGAGTIDIQAFGAVTMIDGATISGAANVLLTSGTTLSLGAVSTTGAVYLSGGAIVDSGSTDVDVTAAILRMVANTATGSGIGSAAQHLQLAVGTLSVSSLASAAGSGIYLEAIGSVTIDAIGQIQVNRVNNLGTTTIGAASPGSDLISAGNLVLSASGSITVNQGNANATGVRAAGNLLLQTTGATADINLNAQVASTGGSLTISAGRDLAMASTIITSAAGASIDLAAARAVVMANNSLAQTNAGNIAVRAGSDATIELLNAGSGSVAVVAGGSIVDQDGAADSDVDIIASALQIKAGNAIGSAASSLETTVDTLSANAGAGGVYLYETDALSIDSVTVQVNRVDGAAVATATSNAVQANLTASGSGNIAVSATALTISDDVTSVAGAILLSARTGSLTQNNAVSSTSGAISLLAAGALAQNAAIGTAASVDVASGAAIVMQDGAVTTAGANVRYAAAGAISVGAIVTPANVSLLGATIIDAGGAEVDVSANALRLSTTGAGDVHLQTAVNTVAANVAGGLSLSDSDALTVGSVAPIAVTHLNQDGTVSSVADAAMTGATVAGNLLLQGGASDVTIAEAVLASGNISINSARDIVQNAAVQATTAGASVDLLAARNIIMSDTGVIATNAGNIALRAVAGSATIGALDARSALDRASAQLNGQAGWGAVAISAGVAIADNTEIVSAVDVYASSLRVDAFAFGAPAPLQTEVAVLSAAIGAGGITVQEASAIAIGATAAIGVNRVAYDGSTSVTEYGAQAGLTSAGAAVVVSGGDLTVSNAVAASANLLLQSQADLLVNAAVASSAGNISLSAARDIVQNAAISTATSARTIDLAAGRNIAMAAGSVSATTNGNLLLTAGGDITVATLNAGSGSVAIDAGASILDQDSAGDNRVNISAAGLQLKAGNAIGAGANHLEMQVATLSAAAGAGGMYLSEADGVTVDRLAVQVQRVDALAASAATANAAQADLRTSASGNIVLASASGAIVLNDGDANGSAIAVGGNLLVTTGGAVAVNASLASAGGDVSVIAAGAIAMAGSTGMSGAQVRIAAGGNAAIGNVSAVGASIVAGGAISNAGVAAGGFNVNAANLRLQAGGAIGSGSNKLTTAVDSLSAAGAGVYISEFDGVVINATPAVLQVNLDGSSSASADSLQAGLVSTANGTIVLSAGGSVQVADGEIVAADGSGNVLLQAQGGALALGVNADVSSVSGHLTIVASGAISLATLADLRTAGSGDIDIEAGGGFTQLDGSTVANAAGSIRLQAQGDVTVASVASGGNVAITSVAGSIFEDGDAAVDIAADGLRLSAANAIGALGTGFNAIDISVATVSARAGNGGINLSEASDIVVGDVSVAVNVVNAAGSTTVASVARQADLRTTDSGSIVLDAANSFIILNEGSGAADGAVAADGSGNVLLKAGVSIIANADILSGSGHVTLLGASLVEFKANADIRTGGVGAIDVEASTGAIVQNASSVFTTGSGNIRLLAQTNATLGDIATGGDVAITAATGFIGDADPLVNGANDADNDISAHALRLSAGGAIGIVDLTGSTSNAIETSVGVISARAGGAIGVVNSGAASIGSVGGSAYRVGLDGAAVLVTDPLQSGVAGSGALAMTFNGDLNIDASVSAASLNLIANAAINVAAGVTVASTGGAASVDAKGGALTMAGSANVNASTNLRLHAAGDIVVGNLTAVNVSLVADSGAIVNAVGSSKNVSATTLRLQADDAIGSATRRLSTAVGTVSAFSRGTDSSGIYLSEDDALVVGSTGFGVDAAQTDLRANNGSIVVDSGGAFSMAGSVNLVAAASVAVHAASGSLTIGNLSAATVSLSADSGAIVNAAGSSRNISADSAVLRASGAIGASTRALSTSLASLDASGAALYVTEENAIRLAGLTTSTGNLVVTTTDGAITVDGAVAAGRNVLLAAGGAGADLVLNNSVTSTTGAISLRAGRDLLIQANAAVRAVAAAQTIDLAAARNLAMADGSSIVSNDSAILLAAGADATIETINAGNANVGISAGGSVIDQDADGDTGVDINAGGLRISAGGAIGSAVNHLETAVTNLAALATSGALFIDEQDGLNVGSVDVAISRIDASGARTTVAAGVLAGLTAASDIKLTAAGALTTLAAVQGGASVNLAAAGVLTSRATVGAAGNLNMSATGAIVTQAALSAGLDAAVTSGDSISTAGSIAAGGKVTLSANGVAGTINTSGMITATGDVALTAMGAIGAQGAIIGGANVGLTAGAAISAQALGAGGNLVLSAGAAIDALGAIDAGGTITLNAGGGIGTAAPVNGGGNVGLNAGGAIATAGAIGGNDVNLTAGGAIATAGAISGTDVNLTAGGAISIAAAVSARGNAVFSSLDNIATQAAVSAAGNASLTAAGAIDAQGALSAGGNVGLSTTGAFKSISVQAISAGAAVNLTASGDIRQAGAIGAAGSAVLRAAGAVIMADGASTVAAAIDVAAAGDVIAGLLDAGTGAVTVNAGGGIVDAQPDGAVQVLNVRAGSAVLMAARGIGSATNALETAVASLGANSAAGDIVVQELDGLVIGAAGLSAASGNVVLRSTSGTLDLAQSFTSAAGKDLTLAADHIVLQQAVRGNGGKLTIDAASPQNLVQAGAAGATIDQASLSHLAGGYAQVAIGAGVAGNGQDVRIDGTASTVAFKDALLVDVAGSGSVITVAGVLSAPSIDARAALAVDGKVTIAAGNGATVAGGDMLFEQGIDGAAAGSSYLALAAGGDSVVVRGAIGANVALAGLTIDNAANVSFASTVTVAGAVVINATGTVRFDGPLTLDNGSITIRGASEVVIGDVVFHGQAGVVVIEANTLTLNGDVQGADTVRLHPTDISRDIVVGGVGGAYNISTAQLAHLANATQIIIGTQGADGHAAVGAGPVTVNAIDFAALTGAPIQVYGSSVTLAAGSGILHAANGIVLDGRDGVVLHDSVGSVAGDIKIYSALGAVTMDADGVIAGSAGVTLQGAGNLTVGLVTGENVVLRSGGVIVDAAADDKVNVTAQSVSIIGYGPKLGSGNAVEVQATSIYVSAPTGMVLQDTGADGRTHFYLLDGATMYEQAIGIGAVTRSTAAPVEASAALAASSAPSALAAVPVASFATHVASAASYLAGSGGSAGVFDAQVQRVLTASAAGLVATAPAANGSEFDYWLEDLML